MSRRRSNDPSVPISIAIPRSLHTRLNELLAFKQSRSKWVCDAIKAKIDAHDDESQVIDGLSSKRLAVLLYNRNIITYELFERIAEYIENKSE
tara:strand:+ start:316 stop:594 length:279 start_codon:yes stop_codon:yes gene_type:complete